MKASLAAALAIAIVFGSVALPAVAGAGPGTRDGARRGEERSVSGTVEQPAGIEVAVDSLIGPLVKSDLISGAILIATSGDVLVAKGFGLADREHGAPNTTSTPFRIASASKAITAVAVLQLVEAGRLSLDSTLEPFVPGFANGDRITVKELLGHTSGIPSDVYLDGFGEKSVQSMPLEDEIDWVRKEAQPRFEPGARFDYSNTNYLLLTSIIERASGLPYEQYLASHIFGPAGMISSGLDSAGRILPGRARGYARSDSGEAVEALGSTAGFVATLRQFRTPDVTVVVLMNCDFMLYEDLFDQLSSIALGKPWQPVLDEAADSTDTRLSAMLGTYRMEDGALREPRFSGGRLEFGGPGSGKYFPVHTLSEQEGYVAAQNARLRFRPTDGGGVELFALYGNLAWRGVRIAEQPRRH